MTFVNAMSVNAYQVDAAAVLELVEGRGATGPSGGGANNKVMRRGLQEQFTLTLYPVSKPVLHYYPPRCKSHVSGHCDNGYLHTTRLLNAYAVCMRAVWQHF